MPLSDSFFRWIETVPTSTYLGASGDTLPIFVPQEDRKLLAEYIARNKAIEQGQTWYRDVLRFVGPEGIRAVISGTGTGDFEQYRSFVGVNDHLDIGSGSGHNGYNIRQWADVRVELLDISDRHLAPDVYDAVRSDPRLDFRTYHPSDPLPYADGSFDSVSLFYVLHHCSDKAEASRLLEETRRVMRPNGTLIVIEEPVKNPGAAAIRSDIDVIVNEVLHPHSIQSETAFDFANFFTPEELADTFRHSGFLIERVEEGIRFGWLLPRSIYLLRRV